jgi:hypothetical protein
VPIWVTKRRLPGIQEGLPVADCWICGTVTLRKSSPMSETQAAPGTNAQHERPPGNNRQLPASLHVPPLAQVCRPASIGHDSTRNKLQ